MPINNPSSATPRIDNPICELFSHFIEGAGRWIACISGTGTSISYVAIVDTASPGIAQLNVGTTAAGRAFLLTSQGSLNGTTILASLLVGQGGQSIYTTRIRTPVASDGTDTFLTKLGFLTRCDVTESPSGVFFRYNVATSANWQIVCRNSGVETAVTTSVAAAANTWDNFKIIVSSGGTAADFFINGTNVGTITNNIPTANGVGAGAGLTKTLGITNRTIEVDYQYVGVGV